MRSLAARFVAGLVLTFLVVWGGFCVAGDTELQPLVVETSAGPQTFKVEIADDPDEREQGLMFRHELAPDHGMLFDSGDVEQVIYMWMKNTYIPLDMLFITRDGRIVRIAENTEPRSERIISSSVPVRSVLEVPGGTAARLHIKVGDRVKFPLFDTSKP